MIPVGGANALGSQGYLAAVGELRTQLTAVAVAGSRDARPRDLVVVPDGSGGTHAGLAAGFGNHERVLGISVGAFPDVAERVRRLAVAAAELAGLPEPAGRVQVDLRFAGAGYGAKLAPVLAAMRLAARTEGLVLDPVYTGKALAALRERISEDLVPRDATIVFVHCGGGFGLLSDEYAHWASEQELIDGG